MYELWTTLREMQSFESGLTARVDHDFRAPRSGSSRTYSPVEETQTQSERRTPTPLMPPDTPKQGAVPLDETSMHSRYSTEVFDVLQTSRGLPSLDRISPTSHETTIRLSLKADDSAAPRDDPRFVIWGEVEPEETDATSPTTPTDFSSGHSGISRRKSLKDRAPANSMDMVSVSDGSKKMMVAATIERWIAQLTSELDYDELLTFLLTYRTYVSAVESGILA